MEHQEAALSRRDHLYNFCLKDNFIFQATADNHPALKLEVRA